MVNDLDIYFENQDLNNRIDIKYSTMFNENMPQALTIPNIISAMKKAGFTTKADLQGLRKQINKDQDEARAEFFQEMTIPKINEIISESESRLTTKIESVESNLTKEVDGLKAEFSTTPSRIELNKLKADLAALQS